MSQSHPLQDSDVIARVDTVVATDMDGEIIMMSVESGQYYHFDDIATSIWHKLEQPSNFGEIVSHLRGIYDVQLEDCQRDTAELIGKLVDFNVLKLA